MTTSNRRYSQKGSREISAHSRAFSTRSVVLFDVGVAGILTRREITEPKGEAFGKAFEHFIHMELRAHRSYSELEYDIQFWRTKSGLEVDFVLGNGEVAVEVKASSRVAGRDLRALNAFAEEFQPKHALVVCTEKEERVIGKVRIVPWKTFLSRLWAGDYLG